MWQNHQQIMQEWKNVTLIGNRQDSALKSVSKTIEQNIFWFWFYWEHLVLLLRSKSSLLAHVYKWLVTISNIYLGIPISRWKSISMEYMNNEDRFHMFTYVCMCVHLCESNRCHCYSKHWVVVHSNVSETVPCLTYCLNRQHVPHGEWSMMEVLSISVHEFIKHNKENKSQKISSIRKITRHHQVRHFQHLAELRSPAEINCLEFPTY